ncbi:MAG: glycosyltransferase family 2 protein [Ktedonobacteraceae bacterium]|nr:glycosyltransferase family 2 protein [Ktedonobacteraceae bacterium]
MFISIITPTYNRGGYPFLKDLCQSIAIAKKYEHIDLEHLIVNDGSNDNTEQVILDMQKTFPFIKYLKNAENKGITFSKNHALREAKGELVMDVDDDDIIPFYAIGLRSGMLQKSEKMWLCGNALKITEAGMLQFTDNLLGYGIEDTWKCFRAFYEGKIFAYAGTRLYYKEALERIQGWNEDISSLCEDFDLWLRLISSCGSPAFCPIPLIYWREKECSLGIDALKSGAYLSAVAAIKSCYRAYYEEACNHVSHTHVVQLIGKNDRDVHQLAVNVKSGRAPGSPRS